MIELIIAIASVMSPILVVAVTKSLAKKADNTNHNIVMKRLDEGELVHTHILNWAEGIKGDLDAVKSDVYDLKIYVEKDQAPKNFDKRLRDMITHGVCEITGSKYSANKLKIIEYLIFVENIILESMKLHLQSNMSNIVKDSSEFQIGLANTKDKFEKLFGKKLADAEYANLNNYDSFLKDIELIERLHANSKKERYLLALEHLMSRTIAQGVDFVLTRA